MNKFSKFASLFLVVFVLCLTGCGNKAKVTGTVKFADGSPLTVGTVNFTDGNNLFRGEIQSDGSFEMRTFKPGDGILKGSYKVYLTETLQFGETSTRVQKGPDGEEMKMEIIGNTTSTLDPKYSDPEQSGLTIDVKGNMTYDITIE
ncbi:MAG: hypothetical protein ACI4NP_03960 [Thermoguttaceae bacterium]